MTEEQAKTQMLVAKAMQSVKDDLRSNPDVLRFSFHMISIMVKFLRMTIGDDKVAEYLYGELEELKTPLTPEDYPPRHPKGKQ